MTEMDPHLTKIDRFIVQRSLGAGGMGEVFLAYDPKLKRQVAVKGIARNLEGDPGRRLRLLQEAQRMTALDDPNITTVHDIIEENERMFIVMEYVEGFNLRERLVQQPISFDEFMNIAQQCARALASAHGKGIAHGDLKPANIMLSRSGDVKICDFGLARDFIEDAQTPIFDTTVMEEPIAGTPAYMSPEVLQGQRADGRSDIFALGIVFYEMLAGRHPFLGPTKSATGSRILYTEPEPLPSVVPKDAVDVEAIILHMLRKDPATRYTAQEVFLELSGASTTTRLANPPEPVHHLVVLPFSTIGDDPEQRAFADGLTETLTIRLAKLTLNRKSLQIISAGEVRQRRIQHADEALKELGANVVLRGGLQWAGRRLRISVYLSETRTGKQLHADIFDIETTDVFETQDRIADQILRTFYLEGKGTSHSDTWVAARTRQPGAYEFYLQGRGYLQHYLKSENLECAIAVFERALAADPEFALAYAGLGETYWRKYELSKEPEWVQKSRTNCEKAMLLDPNLADAQAAIGMIFNGTGEYDSAILAFRRAIERDPTNDSYYSGLAFAYEQLGRHNEAEDSYRSALSVRPYNWIGYNNLGKYLFNRGRPSEAIEMFKHVVALVPDSFPGYSSLGVAYYAVHLTDDAINALQKSMDLRLTYAAASNLGTIYYYEERYDLAVDAYRKALSLNEKEYRVWGNLGSALRWLGDEAGSREAYERAIKLVQAEIEINPHSATMMAVLGDYCAEAGQIERGRALMEDALRLSPDNCAVLLRAASIFEDKFGDRDRALECITKALRLGSSVDQVLRNPSLKKLRDDPRLASFTKRAD
jgi:serine/threonine protein kinase/tetratricopeptide (TPR) repeat protein